MNVAIYARRSYYADNSDSVRMQVETCKDYARDHFAPVDAILSYEDDGFVRSNIDRPGMNRLKEDVDAGLIDCVVIYRIDRICSDMKDFCDFYAFLKDREVKFVTVQDGIDTTTPMGEAMMYLAVIFSGLEIGNDSIRIRDGMNHLASRGYWCGGRAPFGYRVQEVESGGTKKHKILIPDQEEAEVRNQIAAMFLDEHTSLTGLETRLRKMGVKTSRGTVLTSSQLHVLLASPFCAEATPEVYDYFSAKGCIMDEDSPRELWDGKHGVMVYGRTTGKKHKHSRTDPTTWRVSIGRHAPTMSAETWLAVQARFGRNKIDRTTKHPPALLKGVLRCKCGRLMGQSYKTHTDGEVVAWYKCPRRDQHGPESCDMSQIRTYKLDDLVLDVFKQIRTDPAKIRAYLAQNGDFDQKRQNALLKKEKDAEAKIRRLTRALSDAEDSPASRYILEEIEELDRGLRGTRDELAKLSRGKLAAGKREEDARAAAARIASFDGRTAEELNLLAREVIKECTWDGETLRLVL